MSDLRFDPDEMRRRGYDPTSIAEAERAIRARTAAQAMIKRIEQTFGAIPRPRITLGVARAYDNEWTPSDERIAEVTALDPEQDWRDVADEAMKSHQEYFTFSDAEGCRFYLPAYMCMYLRGFPYDGHDTAYWACTDPTKLEALTAAERDCVAAFMDLCHEFDDDSLRQKYRRGE